VKEEVYYNMQERSTSRPVRTILGISLNLIQNYSIEATKLVFYLAKRPT
jgi:hypothetical protein